MYKFNHFFETDCQIDAWISIYISIFAKIDGYCVLSTIGFRVMKLVEISRFNLLQIFLGNVRNRHNSNP